MKTLKLTRSSAISALKNVIDPELNLDIWTLGLIYEISIDKSNKINIKMTFTSPMCPYGPTLVEGVKDSLKKKGFKNPNIDVVFNPVWQPSEEVKILLGVA